MKIPFFNYPYSFNKNKHSFESIFKDVCQRGAYILQKDLVNFEKNLAKYIKAKHVIGVSDGTNALILGMRASGIKENDEIIISSHTYIATAAAIKLIGATPVFSDIGKDNLLSDSNIEQLISKRTKAIMPTQLNGRCCNMDGIMDIAQRYDLDIFEDSAQGLGAKFKEKFAGTFGKFGTFSFYPAKLLGCFGDGGAVITNDDEIAKKVYLLRDHGRDENGTVVSWGTNSRLDNLQAAFLDFKLRTFEDDIKRRREIAGMYDNEFRKHPKIIPPPGPNNKDGHFDVYQNYEGEFDNRDQLKLYLQEQGIGTLIQWGGKAVHHFQDLGYGIGKYKYLNKTNKFFKNCLMLPMNTALSNVEVNYIISKVLSFYDGKN